jgi:hypothetical protein
MDGRHPPIIPLASSVQHRADGFLTHLSYGSYGVGAAAALQP